MGRRIRHTGAPYNDRVQILDAGGRPLSEVIVRLSEQEIAELLVAASEMDDGATDHAVIRDPAGTTVALYRDAGEPQPLERHLDWWVGPLILAAVLLMVIGAFTLARGAVRLLF